ncbi:MAG: Tol-Pal system beta propeller repeat protein TolB [Nitrospinae bacterium]|nr:Tol-Pal system beta propeller repeat protein TolB [Nitrospinota bacterium]
MFKRVSCLRRGLALAVFAACVYPAPSRAIDVYIDVTRKRAEHIKVAVPEYVYKREAGSAEGERPPVASAKDIMEFDLQFSGYFGVLKDEAVINEISAKETPSNTTDWGLWRQAGVDLLVKGAYAVGSDGTISVENTLSDVVRSEQLAGVRYTGVSAIFRKMIHKFADQIVYRFTGEPGVADTRLAFTARVGSGKELFLCDYDGQNAKQLSSLKSIVLSPRWSPSGSELSFTSFHNRMPAAFWLNLRTGEVRAVVNEKGRINSASAWSQDGKTIAFAMSEGGNFDIYTISADGYGLKKLTHSASIDTSPSFSPDGKRIVFVSDRVGRPQLFIMDADGGNQKRFTYNGDYNADPVWSPKGDKIAYAAMTGDAFNIMVKSLDGSIEKQLTENAGKNESPSWSPDGRNLAFTSSRTGTRQVFIMNANGEHQQQVTNMPNGAYGVSWGPRQ